MKLRLVGFFELWSKFVFSLLLAFWTLVKCVESLCRDKPLWWPVALLIIASYFVKEAWGDREMENRAWNDAQQWQREEAARKDGTITIVVGTCILSIPLYLLARTVADLVS